MFKKILFLLLILLTACSPTAEEPQRIAAYPAEKQIAVHPLSPDKVIVNTATIDLAVSNVDKTVDKVHNLVFEYGGYVTRSQAWLQNNDKFTTMTIAVPQIYFEAVHRNILALGDLKSEYITGDIQPESLPEQSPPYAYITINLHPKASVFPALTLPDWRPLQTLAKAWNVLAGILGFLLDILIWVGVVGGPFILLGAGLRRWLRRRSVSN